MASLPIRMIVGLGNPGLEYERTRHNAGFWLLDAIADDLRTSFIHEKSFFGWVAKARVDGETLWLVKPATYMNRSGQAVGALARFYRIPVEQVLVAHDELDLPPGHVKLKQGGGHAGHNGLRDIQSALGSPAYWRLRLGIGHPRDRGLVQPVADYVLHPPRQEELTAIEGVLNRCRAVVPALLGGKFEQATRQLHGDNPGENKGKTRRKDKAEAAAQPAVGADGAPAAGASGKSSAVTVEDGGSAT